MVDRVELAVVEHVLDVGRLDRRRRRRASRSVADRRRRSRSGPATWARTLLAWITSARLPSRGEPRGQRRAEELGERGDAALLARPSRCCAPARCRAPGRRAAGSTGAGSRRCWRPRRRGSRARARARATSALGELARVPQHRVGERREVDVVAEQRLGRHRLGDLHERAAGQNDEVERDSVGSGVAESSARRAARWRAASSPSERTGSSAARAAGAAGACGVTTRLPRKSRYQAIGPLEPLVERERAAPSRARVARLRGVEVLVPDLVARLVADVGLEVASPSARGSGRRARATVTCISFEKLNASPASVRVVRPAARRAACTRPRRPRRRSSRGRTCRRSGSPAARRGGPSGSCRARSGSSSGRRRRRSCRSA